MKIIITTFMREDRIKILEQIPKELYKEVVMFTREDRVSELLRHVPTGIQVVSRPMNIEGIAAIRQFCIDSLPRGKVWFIDDQCIFRKRDRREFTDADFIELYNLVESKLDSYVQVGVQPRQFNNTAKGDFKECSRSYSTYGLRTDQMHSIGVRFDDMYKRNPDVKYYEDFYLTLALLTRGFKNLIITSYYFEYNHNVNGGNSASRTLQNHEDSARELRRYFPQFVKLVKKKGGWEGMEDRTEVRINWQSAFKSSQLVKRL